MSTLKIQQNIPLAPYTTFKIGGPAKFFVEVSAEEALLEAVSYAKDNNLPAYIIGGGSNILFSDKGFDGLVIRLISKNNGNQPIVKMRMENGSLYLECWAGENLSNILKLAAESSLSGLEWAAGIPGTLGGAVRGNAGSPLGCMADNIEEVKVLKISNFQFPISNKIPNDKSQIPNKLSTSPTGRQITKYKLQDCDFSYRDSVFKRKNDLIITSATLKLKKDNKYDIESKIKEVIKKRSMGNYSNPKDPSPGSFFQNPIVKDKELIARFERDKGIKVGNNNILYKSDTGEVKLPAGWLIDEAGFLGKKVGGVQVSEKHGNFVVNLGDGKAEEVIMLASMIKQKIREEFHIQLTEEVQLVGF